MKLTNARGSKLVRLGPDDVVNDFANPIQLVTLTADNAWHDFDWSGYEIHMLGTSSPLTYVKVNFSNNDDGVVIVPGAPLRVPGGFSGLRMFTGFAQNLTGNIGAGVTKSRIKLAIVKVGGISVPEQRPSFIVGGVSGFAAGNVFNTGALGSGVYDVVGELSIWSGGAATYLSIRHMSATGSELERLTRACSLSNGHPGEIRTRFSLAENESINLNVTDAIATAGCSIQLSMIG